jgi:hypothetical protein
MEDDPWPLATDPVPGKAQAQETPATGVTPKATLVCRGQTEAGPVIVPGVAGKWVSERVLFGEFPQAFVARTEIFPVVNVDGRFKETWAPALETRLDPDGAVQV